MYKLVISDDEGKTIIVPLVRDQITVGRQDGNTIRLTERNVSRQHARFVRDASGYRIEDLSSYNGITVNGVRIESTADLKDGDRVGVGDYVIALRAESGANTAARPAARSAASQGFGAPPPARLVMISPPAPGAEFSMTKSAVSIGRLEELDLCISHRSISREHARVTQKAGGFEIEDLRSANGVRVNGASVKRSPLRSGDIVELGQVRFRFVGHGESYSYDPAEEQSAVLTPQRAGGPGKQTVAMLVGAAAVAGAVLAFCQDGNKQAGAAMRKDPPANPAVAPLPEEQDPDAPDDRDQAESALQICRAHVEKGSYADAVRAADEGLALPGSGDELATCKRSANDALRARSAYEEGTKALAENKLEDAYFLFAGIPDEHAFRDRPEVRRTIERVAEERLGRARKLLRTAPPESRQAASAVLEMQDAPQASRDEATRLIALASAAPAAPSEPPPASKLPTAEPVKPRPAAPATPDAKPADEDPAKVARNCLARGDQRCVVRALEGKAESAQELALLIETYRALGETKKAIKHMETFVARYATARQTPQYRQFIAKHEP
jgi:pSer/pThr/pTyr-binding forkhead associated (FHA) protein